MHILIADDEPVALRILESALRDLGHTVLATCDGRGLLQRFQETPYHFDAVITDIRMPYVNGLEAARTIKRIRRIAVVSLSICDHGTRFADGDGHHIPWSMCDYILGKPLDVGLLRGVLEDIAHENRHLADEQRGNLSTRQMQELSAYGLYFKCPVTQLDNPTECQLHDLRESMTFEEFRQHLLTLPAAQLEEIIRNHYACPHNCSQRQACRFMPGALTV